LLLTFDLLHSVEEGIVEALHQAGHAGYIEGKI
jgi:hypothetical protein